MSDPTSPPPERPGGQPEQPGEPGAQPQQPSAPPPPPAPEPPGAQQPETAYPTFPGGADQGVSTGSGPSGPRAGFWQRFGALILDALILAVPNILLYLILDVTVAQILGTLLNWAYFVYFEGGPTGMTPGKRALGIRVVDFNTGGPIGYGRAFVRQIVEIISGLVIFLGYLWMLWDREKQCWHDKAANDVVVPLSAYPVNR